MQDRDGIFAGNDPIAISQSWLVEAEASELNDANAMALATVDEQGMPNVRMVLLKEIDAQGFVFYTNFNSKKSGELDMNKKAGFVIHWKSLRRQIRVRGTVSKIDDARADAYFASRSVRSRLGARASDQSAPLENRAVFTARVAREMEQAGEDPKRPENWGGFHISPVEIEHWADGPDRMHDRFRWTRETEKSAWAVTRLYP